MQAILIDPVARSIATVETNGTAEHLHQLVQSDRLEVMPVSFMAHGHEDSMLFAEEIDFDAPGYFQFDGEVDFLGRAVVIGTDADGKYEDVSTTVDEIKRKIEFKERS